MTPQPDNVDALFYFVKEYFPRNNKANDAESTEFRNGSAMQSSTDTSVVGIKRNQEIRMPTVSLGMLLNGFHRSIVATVS